MTKGKSANQDADRLADKLATKMTTNGYRDSLSMTVIASLFALISAFFLSVVHDYVPIPYMDEEFHVRQVQKYCDGNFTQWDPKITTPPGLYLVSIGLLKPLSLFTPVFQCSNIIALRSINVLFAIGNLYLFYAITRKLNQAQFCHWRCSLTAINLATFPVLYFFAFLYYTDPGSVFFVFLAYLLSIYGSHWTATIIGAVSLFFRQTNIVWIAFIAAVTLKDIIQKEIPSKQLKGVERTSLNYSTRFIRASCGAILDREKRSIILGSVIYKCGGYLMIGLGFVAFVWINGGIVLGDRLSHLMVIHIPQLFYLAAFILFFSLPISTKFWRYIVKNIRKNCKYYLLITFVSAVFMTLAVAFNTRAHPYLLADNRHYTFYIWRKFFGRHPAMKFAPMPFYMLGGIQVIQQLGRRRDNVWCLLFMTCVVANIVTHELLEFRYFIVPYLMFRLQAPIIKDTASVIGLSLEFCVHNIINGITLYLFLYRPFIWPDRDVLQRFMW